MVLAFEPAILGPMLAVSMGLFAVGAGIWFRQRRREIWRTVAEGVGLRFEAKGLLHSTDEMHGVVEGQPLSVTGFSRQHGNNRTIYTRVRMGAPGLNGLKLSHEGLGANIAKAFGGEDFEVGDAAFDDRVRVRGEPHRILAAMGPDERRAVLRLLDERQAAKLEDGAIVWEGPGVHNDPLKLRSAIEDVKRAALRLSEVPDREGALRTRALKDPAPGVRVAAIEALIKRFPGPETEAVLDECAASEHPIVSGTVRRIRGLGAAGGLALEDAPAEAGAVSLEARKKAGALSKA